MCFTSFPTGFQVGGRAARDKVTGGAGFSVDVGKDDGGFTPGDGQMQDCLEGGGGDCGPGPREISAAGTGARAGRAVASAATGHG